MTIAIMQPYIFPYLGYFQMIKAVDKFVIYDDVNYINKGWINRNRILVSGAPHLFTIPLKDASQNKLIYEIELSADASWRKKLLRTIQQSYQKAPNYSKVIQLIEEVVNLEAENISELNLHGIRKVAEYLSISTEIVSSSRIYDNGHLKGQDRILDICRQENAERYINAIGGMELYDKSIFEKENIQLSFIKCNDVSYSQFKNAFVPWLSIVDVLMFCDIESINTFLELYELK